MHNQTLFKSSLSLYHSKNFFEAYKGFRKVFERSSNDINLYNQSFDYAAFSISRVPSQIQELKDFLLSVKNNKLDPIVYNQYFASLKFFEKDYKQFWKHILMSSPYDSQKMGPWSRGTTSLPVSENWINENKLNLDHFYKINLNNQNKNTSVQTDYVVLFTADKSYFNQFHKFPILSSRKLNMNIFLHFHIINPDISTKNIINNLSINHKNIGFSFENKEDTQKAFFASSRFLIAYQILKFYEKPLFIFDIDVTFEKNLKDLFVNDNWDKNIIGIRYNQNGYGLPWQLMAAGAMYLPFTEMSLLYCQKIKHFLVDIFNKKNNRDLWWIDQNAIFFSLLEMIKLKDFKYQVWGHRLSYLKFPKLFENKIKSLSK